MKNKIQDMPPEEIKIAMIRARISQASFARQNNVSPTVINRVIMGLGVSDRVMRALAKAVGIDVKRIWPSIYLYSEPRKPGRPKSDPALTN